VTEWLGPIFGAFIIVATGGLMAWLMLPRRIPGQHAPDHIPVESQQWAQELQGMAEDVAGSAEYDTSVHQTDALAAEPLLEPSLPPWYERPVREDEPAPLFHAFPLPVLELDLRELSHTYAWNRAAKLAEVNEMQKARSG
jgi:hypothetical protein